MNGSGGGDGRGGGGGGRKKDPRSQQEKSQQALDQRQDFATSLVENNFVNNGVNPTLEMTLITEMSRGASITGKFNHREATGRLFSHLDFVRWVVGCVVCWWLCVVVLFGCVLFGCVLLVVGCCVG